MLPWERERPTRRIAGPDLHRPKVCFGKPCIRGHRIWVSLVLDLLASGLSVREVCEEYALEGADVYACIAYGAEMARERYVEIPLPAAS